MEDMHITVEVLFLMKGLIADICSKYRSELFIIVPWKR
jgi:hypothetical protein